MLSPAKFSACVFLAALTLTLALGNFAAVILWDGTTLNFGVGCVLLIAFAAVTTVAMRAGER